jgi:hypothetical protein
LSLGEGVDEKQSCVLIGLPIPPTTNNLYNTIGRRRVPSKELKRFHVDFQLWALSNPAKVKEARLFIRRRGAYRLNIRCHVKTSRLVTLDGRLKTWDASNRIKALEDSISEMMLINDSIFFEVNAAKIGVPEMQDERVDVVVYRHSLNEFIQDNRGGILDADG